MNKRIIELARQSGGIDMTRHADTTNRWGGDITSWIGTGTPEFLERFAELIVQECIDKIGENFVGAVGTHASANNSAVLKCQTIIKEHFGVEE